MSAILAGQRGRHRPSPIGPRPLVLRARAAARKAGATREAVSFAATLGLASLPLGALYAVAALASR